MTFTPPFCPNPKCDLHRECDPKRIVRWGFYHRDIVDVRQQRFRCLTCGRTFSEQTFRHGYRDQRPDLNAHVYDWLTSGVGLRQTARKLELSATGILKKMRKLARTCGLLHENLSKKLPPNLTYVMDEEESYEGASIRPLTVPILIERKHWFIVATEVGSIRRLAEPGTRRRRKQDRDERLRGRRPDESRKCVAKVLRSLRRRTSGPIKLLTDQKSSYTRVAQDIFGDDLVHAQTPGRAPRTTRNPLFSVNTTIAMSRDNCGRLRRRSWLVSKLAKWLRGQLAIYTVYRNYTRRRFNYDDKHETSASLLGLLPRQLKAYEVVRWRQDWGPRSLHPMSQTGHRTVAESFKAGGVAM